jgi:fucose 4-O-acetylase-like acetyltransferase
MNKDIKLSNVKGLLIFCVVLGHLLAPYHYFNILYLFVYSFHMPLFILLTGYFAKHVKFRKVVNFVLVLMIFQLFYRSFLVLINPGKIFNYRWEVPYYHLWFLLGTVFWYLIAIAVNKLQLKSLGKVVFIILCFLISIAAKFIAGPFETYMKNFEPKFISDTFSYMRTLTFLPFFFLGFYLTEEKMQKLYRTLKGNLMIPIFIILGVIVWLSLTDTTNEEKILKGNYGIGEMDGSLLFRTGHILSAYIIALVIGFIILNVISGKKCLLTKWGDRTLPIYLFHAFFVMLSKKVTFLEQLNPWILLLVMLLADFAIISLLSSDIFIKYTYYIWNPYQLFENIAQKMRRKPADR